VRVRLLGFGAIEVDGREYEHDIVIDGGRVRQRKKKPSKPYRNEFGHTPLSAEEELPWGGSRLIIGTGAYGSLPIMAEVIEEAGRRGVDLVALPTEDACQLIASLDEREVHARTSCHVLTVRHRALMPRVARVPRELPGPWDVRRRA
jgi:hypothetical protein